MGSTGASVLKILRNANVPIGVVSSRQTRRPFMRLLGSDGGGGEAESGRAIGADKSAKPDPTTSRPRDKSYVATGATAYTAEDTCDQSSRDMLEKLRREIDRLAGSIIRQDIVDNGLNAAMTAWHLTDWVWKKFKARRDALL